MMAGALLCHSGWVPAGSLKPHVTPAARSRDSAGWTWFSQFSTCDIRPTILFPASDLHHSASYLAHDLSSLDTVLPHTLPQTCYRRGRGRCHEVRQETEEPFLSRAFNSPLLLLAPVLKVFYSFRQHVRYRVKVTSGEDLALRRHFVGSSGQSYRFSPNEETDACRGDEFDC